MNILVLFVHNANIKERIGGGERRFLELGKRWKKSGVKTLIIERKPSIARIYDVGTVYSEIPQVNRYLTLLYCLVHTIWLYLKYGFDLILIHKAREISSVITAYIIKKITRKPWIVIGHHLEDYQKEFHCNVYYNILRRNSSPLKAMLFLIDFLLIRILLKKAEKVLVYSNSSKQDFIRFGLSVRKILRTDMGVDKLIFRKLNLSKKYDCIFMGRLNPSKGIDDLINAWINVVSYFPNALLAVVGNSAKLHYQKIVEEKGLSPNIEFIGFINKRKKIAELLNSSQIFVLPSYKEGFGLAVLEAMSCGLPCILYDIETFKGLFAETALLIRKGDIDSLSKSIIKLLKDNILRERLSISSLHYSDRFDWDILAERELLLLKKLTTD